jgi:tripartite-type tricarboxylate transporter receptor subunit TctC
MIPRQTLPLAVAACRVARFGVVCLGLASFGAAAAAADPVADFYKGKTVALVVGHEVGSGYDVYARVLARHLGRHIPGQPSIVVQNMVGAAGMIASNWLYNIAPRDGTVVATFSASPIAEPILGNPAARYEPAKFTWIGNMDESIATCTVSARSGITSLDQLFTREAVFGATGSAAPTSKFAYALVNFLGARIKVVQGYKGSNDLRIALNRGEIEGACGPSHSTLKTQWKDDVDSGRIRALVQFGLKKLPDLKDAAHIYDYAKSSEDREIFDVAFGPHVLGRPVIAPPGVPADRAGALRAAFMRTMQDAELLAETGKLGLEIRPSSGAEVEALVARFASFPKQVIERATAGLHEKR